MPETFDYLVLGGGTAGCVIAGQIIERQLGSVAIVEQGLTPRGPMIYRPALYTRLFGSRWDEACVTIPQTHLRGRRLSWPRGKMLGGSSGINAMIYSRGSPGDFDMWPANWGYKENVDAFQAIERRIFSEDGYFPTDRAARLRGNDRPSLVESDVVQSDVVQSGADGRASLLPLSHAFLKAAQQAGYPLVTNAAEAATGACRYLRTQRNGRRQTAYDLFLKAHLTSRYLSVFSGTQIERIEIAGTQAVAIHGSNPHGRLELRARRAIVLAAGAIRSPEILMRSGIGSTEELRRIGVETMMVVEEVGHNLQDHLAYPIIHATHSESAITKNFDRETRLRYLQHRDGPVSSNLAEVGAFFSLSSNSPAPSNRPDVQLHFTPNHYLEYPVRDNPKSAWSIGVTLLHPTSRGTIRCDGGSDSGVIIDPNYLASNEDRSNSLEAVKKAMVFAEQPALQLHSLGELLPGKSGISDDRLAASQKAYSTTLFHPVGTCAIENPVTRGVVDHELRVHGMKNLFVADASIIPALPSANPQAVVMMVAYRLADFLSTMTSDTA